jgi:hypothetical protein
MIKTYEMRNSFFLPSILFLVLFSNCKKQPNDNPPDWKYTDYKFLILDSNIVEYNTIAKFIRVSDSILLFYGYNKWEQNEGCLYKLSFSKSNFSIRSLLPMVYGSPSDIKDISFPDNSTGLLLINDREVNTGIDSKLFKTSDGGQIWNEKIIDFQNTFSRIHFITPDSGIAISENYIGISYDIYTTTDGGNNWQKIVNEYFTGDRTLSGFYFIPQTPRICFISSAGQLFYSTNGGFNWSLHSTHKADIASMSFINENVGYVVNSNIINVGSPLNSANSIYKIDKIGGPYIKMYKADDLILKIEALNENEVYFSQFLSGTLFCTYDGFKTVLRTSIQDPAPNVGGDRIVTEFTMYSQLGVLCDMKGTLYIKNN